MISATQQKLANNTQSLRLLTPLFTFLALVLIIIFGCTRPVVAQATTPPTKIVAITQIVEHPSLDVVRQSFIQSLKDAGFEEGKNLTILYETAQGSVTTAVQIAKKFASLSPDVVLGISTPSAQALVPSLKEASIPLVFAAVSDPVGAKLVKTLDQPSPLVTGATDAQPTQKQFLMMLEILPQLKSIGVVYNPGEINSVKILEQLRAFMATKNIRVIANGASKSSEVSSALTQLLDQVDAVYVTLDNVVVSALQAVLKLTGAQKTPVFSTDPDLVKQGVLASIGNGYADVGSLAGQMAVRILNGENPEQIPISAPKENKLYVNLDVAALLSISIPTSVLSKADYVVNQGVLKSTKDEKQRATLP